MEKSFLQQVADVFDRLAKGEDFNKVNVETGISARVQDAVEAEEHHWAE